jgi:peptidyl-prolyl cis-trans isomerase SurA
MEKLNFKTNRLMKTGFIFLLAAICGSMAHGQTLFTYGNNAVSKDEFLKAYNKNKTENADKEKALREYLDLYSKFKLKVKAAHDMRIDTLPQLKNDLQNFRTQVEESYMNNENAMGQLVNEAMAHARKDLHTMHFFVAADDKIPADTVKAAAAAKEIYNRLMTGEKDYDKIAADLSAKYSPVKLSDIGYITAFTIPYEYEKIIFSTSPGGTAKPYRSKKGWHIFKVLDERLNPGKWRTAQILLAISPGDNESNNFKEQHQKADSIYQLLKQGADFSELAKKFSNDKITYMAGGEMQEFTSGRFEQDFEKEVFKLKKDGDISKPFLTSYGFHIVKRLSVKPMPDDNSDAAFQYEIKQRVLQDSRVNAAKELFTQQVLSKVQYKREAAVKDAELFKYADSISLNPLVWTSKKTPVDAKTIFSFGKSNLTGAQWLDFVKEYKTNPELYKNEDNPALLRKFITLKSTEYYRNHLEDYSTEFNSQLEEFKEGNLLFEVMERRVWSKAAADTKGLQQYYADYKIKYKWGTSADVIVFSASNKKAADDAYAALQNGKAWRKIADENSNTIQADSGRYELAQIAIDEKYQKEGGVTPVQVNATDGSAGFIKVLALHAGGQQRSFEEAKGLVINDYQNLLEEKWIDELKKKYPVKINEQVFQTLLK